MLRRKKPSQVVPLYEGSSPQAAQTSTQWMLKAAKGYLGGDRGGPSMRTGATNSLFRQPGTPTQDGPAQDKRVKDLIAGASGPNSHRGSNNSSREWNFSDNGKLWQDNASLPRPKNVISGGESSHSLAHSWAPISNIPREIPEASRASLPTNHYKSKILNKGRSFDENSLSPAMPQHQGSRSKERYFDPDDIQTSRWKKLSPSGLGAGGGGELDGSGGGSGAFGGDARPFDVAGHVPNNESLAVIGENGEAVKVGKVAVQADFVYRDKDGNELGGCDGPPKSPGRGEGRSSRSASGSPQGMRSSSGSPQGRRTMSLSTSAQHTPNPSGQFSPGSGKRTSKSSMSAQKRRNSLHSALPPNSISSAVSLAVYAKEAGSSPPRSPKQKSDLNPFGKGSSLHLNPCGPTKVSSSMAVDGLEPDSSSSSSDYDGGEEMNDNALAFKLESIHRLEESFGVSRRPMPTDVSPRRAAGAGRPVPKVAGPGTGKFKSAKIVPITTASLEQVEVDVASPQNRQLTDYPMQSPRLAGGFRKKGRKRCAESALVIRVAINFKRRSMKRSSEQAELSDARPVPIVCQNLGYYPPFNSDKPTDKESREVIRLKDRLDHLETFFAFKATLQPINFLQNKLDKGLDDQLDTNSVFNTSSPFTLALSKGRIQMVFIFISFVSFVLGISTCSNIAENYYTKYRYWRFTAISLRDATTNVTAPNIGSLGVLKDGCPVLSTSFLTSQGPSMIRTFDSPINVNGWYFETLDDGGTDSDPVEFSIQGSNDLQSWFDFSGSRWSTFQHGGRVLRPGAYETSTVRGYRDIFDMRHSWHWLVGRLVPDFVISVCLLAIAACGYHKELSAGKLIFLCMWSTTFAVWFVTGLGEHLENRSTTFSFWWYMMFMSVIEWFTVMFFEEYFVFTCFIGMGLGVTLVAIIEDIVKGWNPAGFAITTTFGFVFILIGLFFYILRLSIIMSAALMIEPDEAAYLAAWKIVVEKSQVYEDPVEYPDTSDAENESIVWTSDDGEEESTGEDGSDDDTFSVRSDDEDGFAIHPEGTDSCTALVPFSAKPSSLLSRQLISPKFKNASVGGSNEGSAKQLLLMRQNSDPNQSMKTTSRPGSDEGPEFGFKSGKDREERRLREKVPPVTEAALLWSDSGLDKWETPRLKRKKSIFIGGKADGGVQGHKRAFPASPTLQANQFDVTGHGHVITVLGRPASPLRRQMSGSSLTRSPTRSPARSYDQKAESPPRMRVNNKLNHGINSPIDFVKSGGVKKKSSKGLSTSMPTSAVVSFTSMTRQPSTSSNLTFVPRAMSASEMTPHMPVTPELAREGLVSGSQAKPREQEGESSQTSSDKRRHFGSLLSFASSFQQSLGSLALARGDDSERELPSPSGSQMNSFKQKRVQRRQSIKRSMSIVAPLLNLQRQQSNETESSTLSRLSYSSSGRIHRQMSNTDVSTTQRFATARELSARRRASTLFSDAFAGADVRSQLQQPHAEKLDSDKSGTSSQKPHRVDSSNESLPSNRNRRFSSSTQSSTPFSLPYGLSRQTSTEPFSRRTSGEVQSAASLLSSLTPVAVDPLDELPVGSQRSAVRSTETGGSYSKMFREANAMMLPESSLEPPANDMAEGEEPCVVSAGNARLSKVNSAESRVSSGSSRVPSAASSHRSPFGSPPKSRSADLSAQGEAGSKLQSPKVPLYVRAKRATHEHPKHASLDATDNRAQHGETAMSALATAVSNFDYFMVKATSSIVEPASRALGITQPSPDHSEKSETPMITPLYHPVRGRRPSDMSPGPASTRRSSTAETVGAKRHRLLDVPVPLERRISVPLDYQGAEGTGSTRRSQSMLDFARLEQGGVGSMAASAPNLGKIREQSNDGDANAGVASGLEYPEKLKQEVDDGVIGEGSGKSGSGIDDDERRTFNGSRTALCTSSNRLVKLAELSHQVNIQIDERRKIERGVRAFRGLRQQWVCQSEGPKVVRSLDQLYAIAMSVNPFLLKKTQSYAYRSLGMVTVHPLKTASDDGQSGLPEFALWADAQLDPVLRRRIKWATIKNPQRAIEKAIRTYKSMPCHLLDICRQSIYFESVSDIIQCLQVIDNDREVVIERIKNRLDPDYDSCVSAGYRDVALNIRIVNQDTIKLGAHLHICEMQLILMEFAILKHANGHARYVNFRNWLGE